MLDSSQAASPATQATPDEKDRRIAELEAELETLKAEEETRRLNRALLQKLLRLLEEEDEGGA